MNVRTRVVIVTLSAMASFIAAGVVAFNMLILANANEAVPAFMTSLLVAFLLIGTAFLAGAAALRSKLPPRRR